MALLADLHTPKGDRVDLIVVDVGANPIDGPAPCARLLEAGLAGRPQEAQ